MYGKVLKNETATMFFLKKPFLVNLFIYLFIYLFQHILTGCLIREYIYVM